MSLADLHNQIQVATIVTEKLEKDVATNNGDYSNVRSGIRREFSEFKGALEQSKSRLQELERMQRDLEALERGNVRSAVGSQSNYSTHGTPISGQKEKLDNEAKKESTVLKQIINKVQGKDKALEALKDYEKLSSEEHDQNSDQKSPEVQSSEPTLHKWDAAMKSIDDGLSKRRQGGKTAPEKKPSFLKLDRELKHRFGRRTDIVQEQRDDNNQTQDLALGAKEEVREEGKEPIDSLAARERSFRTKLQLRAHEFATQERTAKTIRTVQSLQSIHSARSIRSTRSYQSARTILFAEDYDCDDIERKSVHEDEKSPTETLPQSSGIEVQEQDVLRDMVQTTAPVSSEELYEDVNEAKSASPNNVEEQGESVDVAVKTSSSYAERETLSEFASRLERSIRMLKTAESTEFLPTSEPEEPPAQDKHVIVSAMASAASTAPSRRPQGTVKLRRERTEPTLPPGPRLQQKRTSSSKANKLIKAISSSTNGSKFGRTLSSSLAKSIRLMTGSRVGSNKSKDESKVVESHFEPERSVLSTEDRLMEECIERQELRAREAYIKAMQDHSDLLKSKRCKEDSQEFILSQQKLQAFFAKIEYWENMKRDFRQNPSAFAPEARTAVMETLSMDNDKNTVHHNEEFVESNVQNAEKACVQATERHQALINLGEEHGYPACVESEKSQQKLLSELQYWESQKQEIDGCELEAKERNAREAYIKSMKYHQKLINSKVEPGSQAWNESERNQRECLARLQYWETLNMGNARSEEEDCDNDRERSDVEAPEMRTIYFDTPKKVKTEVPTKTLLDTLVRIMPEVFGKPGNGQGKSEQKNAKKKVAKKNKGACNECYGALQNQCSDITSAYSDDFDNVKKGGNSLCMDALYSYIFPECVKSCCGPNQPCTTTMVSHANDGGSDGHYREHKPARSSKHKINTLQPENCSTNEKRQATHVAGTVFGPAKTGQPNVDGARLTPGPVQDSLSHPNAAMNAIESEAREILGHLSNDYESTRLDESLTVPSGLSPTKANGGNVFSGKSTKLSGLTPSPQNGGMMFWEGESGGPKDFSLHGAANTVFELNSPRSLDARSNANVDDDESATVSYVLEDGYEQTFFCGLESY